MTKILFISAIDPYSEVQSRFPQLGLAYLASSLRKHFPNEFEIRIVNRNVQKELAAYRPEIVGITAVSQNYGYAKQYARMAKQSGATVIIGGIHISSLPQTMTPDMDLAVLGEGEETIVDLMHHFLDCGALPLYLPGTAWRNFDGMHINPPRAPIAVLDSLPMPARDLVKTSRFANIFSSRGCPYTCTFCASTRYWSKLRFFSAEYVVEELREMATRYGARRISFYDDLMIADRKRLENIVELVRKEPALAKVRYGINARANLITDDTARLLAEMGVTSVGMGLESGCERTLKYLKGGSVTVQDNYSAIQILHMHKISANASFIIGSPDETRAEILETLQFIKRSGLDFVDTFVLVPFPGTPVWEYAKQNGAVSDDMDWSRLNIYHPRQGPPIILSKTIGQEEMNHLCRKFYHARLRIAARTAWTHPFFPAMLRAGAGMLANKIRRITCSENFTRGAD